MCSSDLCHRIKPGAKAGAVAGEDGYGRISLDDKSYRTHLVAWAMYYGVWPTDDIDHINGVKNDNRIANLRLATDIQNRQNLRGAQKNNKSGKLGVAFDSVRNLYSAQIRVNGKSKFLGRFKTPEEASEVYLAYKRQLHEYCTI